MPYLNSHFTSDGASDAFSRFLSFVGYEKIQKSLRKVREQIDTRKIITEALLDRYAIPLGMGDAIKYKKATGRWPNPIKNVPIFEACNFAATTVEIARHLSKGARSALRGRIIDSMKWDRDARPLQHEYTVAANFASKGWEIFFQDIEGKEAYDFLIRKEDFVVEIECKTVSGDVGNAVHQRHALNFFEENAQNLLPFANNCCRTFDLLFDGRPPTDRGSQEQVIAAASKCVQEGHTKLEFEEYQIETAIQPLPRISTNIRELQKFTLDKCRELQQRSNGHAGAILRSNSILCICLSSKRSSKLQNCVYRYIKSASEQLSGQHPGFIWTHFVDINDNEIRHLMRKSRVSGSTGFDGISSRALSSADRKHLLGLGYSARSPILVRRRHYERARSTGYGMEGPLATFRNPVSTFSLPSGLEFP